LKKIKSVNEVLTGCRDSSFRPVLAGSVAMPSGPDQRMTHVAFTIRLIVATSAASVLAAETPPPFKKLLLYTSTV